MFNKSISNNDALIKKPDQAERCNDAELMRKGNECYNCRVFNDSSPAVIDEIGGHCNNLTYLLKEQKRKAIEDGQQIEGLKYQLAVFKDKLAEKEKEIRELMLTDTLTMLYSRHHLSTVLNDEIARCNRYGHSLAVIMIDIDGLRSINSGYGKIAGDRMLAFAGNLIKDSIRKFDKAFRYGGEEFVVVLPETDLTMAYIVSERIRKNFEKRSPDVCVKERGSYTVSIGMTSAFTYTANTIKIEELIEQSDKALAIAKEKGGNMSVKFE